jgi:hypothetical protein
MDDNRFDNVVKNIINLFIDRFSLELENKDNVIDVILNIIIDFNRNCLCDSFFIDYLPIYIQKIEPTFLLYDINGSDDLSIINYSEFFIVLLIILTKYWEDKFFSNRNFSYYYNIPIKRINSLELFILKNINWDLSIKNLDGLPNDEV